MLSLLFENVVCYGYDLDAFDLETCLLEDFALGAYEDALAVVEVAARELPSACISVSLFVFTEYHRDLPAPWLPFRFPVTILPSGP